MHSALRSPPAAPVALESVTVVVALQRVTSSCGTLPLAAQCQRHMPWGVRSRKNTCGQAAGRRVGLELQETAPAGSAACWQHGHSSRLRWWLQHLLLLLLRRRQRRPRPHLLLGLLLLLPLAQQREGILGAGLLLAITRLGQLGWPL